MERRGRSGLYSDVAQHPGQGSVDLLTGPEPQQGVAQPVPPPPPGLPPPLPPVQVPHGIVLLAASLWPYLVGATLGLAYPWGRFRDRLADGLADDSMATVWVVLVGRGL